MSRQQRLEFDVPSEKIVAKANDLVRARHSFSTIEQRIFAMMVAKLDREFTKYSVFSLCRHREGSGTIQAKFNDDMRSFLLELKEKFTLYLITVFLRLRSKYSTQIYELLKMRQGIYRLHMTVGEFRHSLGLENKYERFWQLKRRVLEQAQKELREKADIYFTYNVLRTGNSPEAIEFYIHENESVIQNLRESVSRLKEKSNVPIGRASERHEVSENGGSGNRPRFDPRRMFLEDLTQDEIDDLEEEELDRVHDEARDQAEANNPNTDSASVLAAETHMRMKELWKKR